MDGYSMLPAGDTALVVDFGNRVDLDISAKVLALAHRVEALQIGGVIETVPTIRSLSIYYEPLSITTSDLQNRIASIVEGLHQSEVQGRICEIPVCYDPTLAPDLAWVADQCGILQSHVIELHSSLTYHVYMLGFLPGLAYLGDLPDVLTLPRRDTPRPRIPAGSVGIGGKLTCIYPMVTPCGWHLIGCSPFSLWDPASRDGAALKAGDKVKFKPVSLREYEEMKFDTTQAGSPARSSH